MSEFDFFSTSAYEAQDEPDVEEKTNVSIRIEGDDGALEDSKTATLTITGDTVLLLQIMYGAVIGLDGEITKVTKEY